MSVSTSYLIWGLSVLLGSSSSILTRYAQGMPAASIGFWRTFGASLFLLPFLLRVRRGAGARQRVLTPGTLLVGALFGLHFAT